MVKNFGNSPVPGEFPAQRPVTRSFDVFFDLRLNKRLSKQSWGWWCETLSCSLWRRCNEMNSSKYYVMNWSKFLLADIDITMTLLERHGAAIADISAVFGYTTNIQSPLILVLCEENSPVAGGFPPKSGGNGEKFSMSWCHDVLYVTHTWRPSRGLSDDQGSASRTCRDACWDR